MSVLSKPSWDITSSRVNPFWSHCCTLHIFSLLHLSHSYKANQCHTVRGWVTCGSQACRLPEPCTPFLLLCRGSGTGEELCILSIKGSTYLGHLYKTVLCPKKEKPLQKLKRPCWCQVHVCECMNKSLKRMWRQNILLFFKNPVKLLHWQLYLHWQQSLSWPLAM